MLTLSLYDSSQQDFHHGHSSHIMWENLQAYNIEGTVQQEKEPQNQGAC